MPYPYYNPHPFSAGYAQNFSNNAPTNDGLFCRMVSCVDEVRATPADFSGKPLVFLDASHGLTYTKVFNPATGESEIGTYRRVNEQQAQPVMMEEFVRLQQMVVSLRQELDAIKKPMKEECYAEPDSQYSDRYSQRRRPHADDYDRSDEHPRIETSEQYLARQKRSAAGTNRAEYVPGTGD